MELREMANDKEETVKLLTSSNRQDDDDDDEVLFVERRLPVPRTKPGRRLLSQALSSQHEGSGNNISNHQQKEKGDNPVFSIIQLTPANWPPSRKKEEAQTMENLRKRVELSKLTKTQTIVPVVQNPDWHLENLEQVNNRPRLLKKILSNAPMSLAYDSNDFVTDWMDSEFITEALCWHNVYRQRHGSMPLSMSPQLCEYAQTWANHLAHSNAFYYRNDKEVGQSLYCRPGPGAITEDVTGQDVTQHWYSAVKQYDFRKELYLLQANVNAGHFTQVIWASTSHFGIGKARSRAGKIIVVANYHPVGNITGQFRYNILPPLPDFGSIPISVQLPKLKGQEEDETQEMPYDTFSYSTESSGDAQ